MSAPVIKFPSKNAMPKKLHGKSGNQLVDEAMCKLPPGWSIRLYIERGFFYAYLQRPDFSVRNADMKMRIPVDEQLRLLINELPSEDPKIPVTGT